MSAHSEVIEELIALEPVFHTSGSPRTRAEFDEFTAPDFWEVGASGRRYDREHVWSVVAERGSTGIEMAAAWEMSDIRVRPVGADTYLVTYLLDQGGRITRRLSAWEGHREHWMILYHQGTIVTDG